MDQNPNYPIQVEGWRGAISQEELESLNPRSVVERLIESAYSEPQPRGGAAWHGPLRAMSFEDAT